MKSLTFSFSHRATGFNTDQINDTFCPDARHYWHEAYTQTYDQSATIFN
jgi:hypothetical protein